MKERGKLTDEVKSLLIKEGFEGRVRELRLMPYLLERAMDHGNIDLEKITEEERSILDQWEEKDWIFKPYTAYRINPDFYDRITRIIKLGYVSYVFIPQELYNFNGRS